MSDERKRDRRPPPPRRDPRDRRALSNIGGPIETRGDPELSAMLARAWERASSEPADTLTHGFHSWPARMHWAIARTVIEALRPERIVDPFCGGGTVLVEAMLAGRRAVGRDINPVAVLVAEARTRLCDPAARRALVDEAKAVARAARDARVRIPDPVYLLRDWYEAHVLRELSALRDGLEAASQRDLLRAVHSSLVVKFSRRASDTSARRVETRHPRGAVSRAFVERASELSGMLADLAEGVPPGTVEAAVATGDARLLDDVDPVDLAVTSPPYPATYDYLPLQQLRLAWLGDHGANQAEIGARRHFRRSLERGHSMWLADTRRWLQVARDRLVPGGRLVVMIGDGITRGTLLEARRPSEDAARAAGLSLFAAASIERVDPATQLAKREHALVFERPREP